MNIAVVSPDYTNKALADPNVAGSIADQLLDVIPAAIAALPDAAAVNAEVDNALNTIVPASPTAGSLNDILSKAAGGNTFNKSTDSLEALSEAIAAVQAAVDGLSLLTAKEKAFMGAPGLTPLKEYFNTVTVSNAYGSSPPDTALWVVVKDTGAQVDVVTVDPISSDYLNPHALMVDSGNIATSDAIAYMRGKRIWSIGQPGVTEIHLKSRLWISDLTGEGAFGFSGATASTDASNFAAAENWAPAGIYYNNDSVAFHTFTYNGYLHYQNTNITAYFADATYVDVEIVWSATDVKLYVNGTLRATHSDFANTLAVTVFAGVRNSNSARTRMRVNYVEVWHE